MSVYWKMGIQTGDQCATHYTAALREELEKVSMPGMCSCHYLLCVNKDSTEQLFVFPNGDFSRKVCFNDAVLDRTKKKNAQDASCLWPWARWERHSYSRSHLVTVSRDKKKTGVLICQKSWRHKTPGKTSDSNHKNIHLFRCKSSSGNTS